MTSSCSVIDSKSGEDYYGTVSRDPTETERLRQQHIVVTKSIGFLIHPSIPYDKPDLRIADFATGTGIWLLDVCKVVSPSCQLVGFDISSTQFPPASTLPENVHLHEQDILKPLPESYHGTFDIIALRGLLIVLAGEEWDRVVSNLIPLLRPGGWLQWVDMDGSTLSAIQSQAMAPRNCLLKSIDTFNSWASMVGRTLDGCKRLPSAFHDNGLESIQHDLISSDNDPRTRRDFGIELSTGFSALFARYAEMEGSVITAEEAAALKEGRLEEVKDGKAYFRADLHVVVGRRPEE